MFIKHSNIKNMLTYIWVAPGSHGAEGRGLAVDFLPKTQDSPMFFIYKANAAFYSLF